MDALAPATIAECLHQLGCGVAGASPLGSVLDSAPTSDADADGPRDDALIGLLAQPKRLLVVVRTREQERDAAILLTDGVRLAEVQPVEGGCLTSDVRPLAVVIDDLLRAIDHDGEREPGSFSITSRALRLLGRILASVPALRDGEHVSRAGVTDAIREAVGGTDADRIVAALCSDRLMTDDAGRLVLHERLLPWVDAIGASSRLDLATVELIDGEPPRLEQPVARVAAIGPYGRQVLVQTLPGNDPADPVVRLVRPDRAALRSVLVELLTKEIPDQRARLRGGDGLDENEAEAVLRAFGSGAREAIANPIVVAHLDQRRSERRERTTYRVGPEVTVAERSEADGETVLESFAASELIARLVAECGLPVESANAAPRVATERDLCGELGSGAIASVASLELLILAEDGKYRGDALSWARSDDGGCWRVESERDGDGDLRLVPIAQDDLLEFLRSELL